MTKKEIVIFIEEMSEIDDIWTEEEVERCYAGVPLYEALNIRKSQVGDNFVPN